MKKLVVVSLLLFVGILFAKAQVKPVEGELFAGLAVGASQYNTTGAIIGAELRFNLSKGKISPGFQLSQNSVGIKHTNRNERYTNLQILCDYNLNAGEKVCPFIGAGLGMGLLDGDGWYCSTGSAILSARIGCEFIKRLRITADYRLQKSDCSFFTLRLGYVIEG